MLLYPVQRLFNNKCHTKMVLRQTKHFMLKCIFLALVSFTQFHSVYAQPMAGKTISHYQYYLRISGIRSREDVINIQNSIGNKPGVVFFMANRYPVRYFLLKSDHQVSANEFRQMLNNPGLHIDFFGEGNKAREQAIVMYNKIKTL